MVKYKQENLTGTFVRRRKEEKDSMRSVRQKYISLILILSMFFLGMCCGSTQADSSLMYGILHHTDSVFVNSGVDDLPEQLSTDTTERMISANAYLRQEGRRINTRTNRAVNCLFLIVELLSQLFPIIFACSVFGTQKSHLQDICAQMRRYQKGMVLMVEHILFAVLTAAVIGAAIFMWWFENHDEKTDSGNEKEGN